MSRPRPTIDLGYPTEAHGRIPAFKSVEEEAAFWDTHEVTDYLAETDPVDVIIGQDLTERLMVRLDRADRVELAKRARARGIDPLTLARIWLTERLQQEAEAKP